MEEGNPRPSDVLASCTKPISPTEQRGKFKGDQVDAEDHDGDLSAAPKSARGRGRGRGKGRGRGRGKGRGKGRGRNASKVNRTKTVHDSESHDPEACGSTQPSNRKKRSHLVAWEMPLPFFLADGEPTKKRKNHTATRGTRSEAKRETSKREPETATENKKRPKGGKPSALMNGQTHKGDHEMDTDTPNPKSSTAKAAKGTPKPTSKPDQKRAGSGEVTGPAMSSEEAKAQKKALLSRKSCAYKKARSEAIKGGSSWEDAIQLAKKAGTTFMHAITCSHISMRM